MENSWANLAGLNGVSLVGGYIKNTFGYPVILLLSSNPRLSAVLPVWALILIGYTFALAVLEGQVCSGKTAYS